MRRPNLLLTVSAALFFAAAASLLFAPEELVRLAGGAPSVPLLAALQVLGSAVFGFALLNWMARHTRTDGIFGRPLVMANLGHTASAALLLGHIGARGVWSAAITGATAVYAALAIAFGSQLFSRGQASPAHGPDA